MSNPNELVLKRAPLTYQNVTINSRPPKDDEVVFVVIDTETTGLDPIKDEVIELGMVKFYYCTVTNKVTNVCGVFNQLKEPHKPLSEEVIRITGLNNEDLNGKLISYDDVDDFIPYDCILVAHNASFDRSMVENHRFWNTDHYNYRWVCTKEDIDWSEYSSTKLEWLMFKHGYFYDAHRASTDCLATLQLIMEKPEYLKQLYEAANNEIARLYAKGLPFDKKDEAKAHGFKWDANQKVWYIDIQPHSFGVNEVYGFLDSLKPGLSRQAHCKHISARERYKLGY